MEDHKHDKEEVDWNHNPSNDSYGNGIKWYGKCSCGLRVFEVYSQEPELYNAETEEEV